MTAKTKNIKLTYPFNKTKMSKFDIIAMNRLYKCTAQSRKRSSVLFFSETDEESDDSEIDYPKIDDILTESRDDNDEDDENDETDSDNSDDSDKLKEDQLNREEEKQEKEKQEKERSERLKREGLEKERKNKLEKERLIKEKLRKEKERLEQIEQIRLEKLRKEKLEKEKQEKIRSEKQRLDKERMKINKLKLKKLEDSKRNEKPKNRSTSAPNLPKLKPNNQSIISNDKNKTKVTIENSNDHKSTTRNPDDEDYTNIDELLLDSDHLNLNRMDEYQNKPNENNEMLKQTINGQQVQITADHIF